MFDLLGSLWGCLMATGFMLSTLQPVIVIIRIFDVGRNIPDKFFDPNADPEVLAQEKKWLTSQEQYALEMLTERKNEIPGLISLYPLVYCFVGLLITMLLKKQIAQWFEIILYTEEDEDGEERRRRRRRNEPEEDNMRELTLNDEEEDDGQAAGDNQPKPPRLKTYAFKKPQFMKKLTNTYFTKSKATDKAVIMNKELTSKKLNFSMHKKNTKSWSDDGNKSKLPRLTKPKFTEDMIELPEMQNAADSV